MLAQTQQKRVLMVNVARGKQIAEVTVENMKERKSGLSSISWTNRCRRACCSGIGELMWFVIAIFKKLAKVEWLCVSQVCLRLVGFNVGCEKAAELSRNSETNEWPVQWAICGWFIGEQKTTRLCCLWWIHHMWGRQLTSHSEYFGKCQESHCMEEPQRLQATHQN